MVDTTAMLTIGELAERSGVTVRALRHYDELGLLSPAGRTSSGHRRYGAAEADRLLRIVTLRALGLGLDDIAAALNGDHDTTAAVTRRHLAEVRARRDELAQLELALEAHLSSTTPASTDPMTTSLELTAMTIRLDRITTRTGDDGTTSLADQARMPKTTARIEAIGAVDELNAHVGVAAEGVDEALAATLQAIQQELFDLGADLATVETPPAGRRIGPAAVERLEAVTAEAMLNAEALDSFVLPGGGSGRLHVARTVCRRAERRVLAIDQDTGDAARYLNRLSDTLFVLARSVSTEEHVWEPNRARSE